jgi:hypothetical protein
MVLPTLTRQALTGIPLTVYGTGLQTRSFSYVTDIVEGLLSILERPETSGEVFNLGSDEELTIGELAERVLEITGSTSEIKLIPYEHAYGPGYEDTERRVPNIDKAQRMLGFDPKWALDDVIRAVAADILGQPLPEPTGVKRRSRVAFPEPALDAVRSVFGDSPADVQAPASAPRQAWAPGHGPRVSVVVPIFNEAPSAAETVRRLRHRPEVHQLVVVNDGSTDGTMQELEKVSGLIDKLIHLPRNQGKGAALRAGIDEADGDIVVFQDADMELDPADLPSIIAPIVAGEADAVYGNRLHDGNRRFIGSLHWQGNAQLSKFTNALYGLGVSDMETASKAFRREVLLGMELEGDRFEIEPEVTAKLARMQVRVIEVPITFRPRRRQDGKKMNWWGSGMKAMTTLLKYKMWKPDYRVFSPEVMHRPPAWIGSPVAPSAQYLALTGDTTAVAHVPAPLYAAPEPPAVITIPEAVTMRVPEAPAPPPAPVPAPATASAAPAMDHRAPLNKERIYNGAPGETPPPVMGVSRRIKGTVPTAPEPA